jgi:phosphopantetheinyl transferase
VPIRLDHFYNRRNPRRIELDKETRRQGDKETARVEPAPVAEVPAVRAFSPAGGEPAGRGAVMNQYWNVMEQFLDLQREVLDQFLATRRGPVAWGSEPPSDARAVDVGAPTDALGPRIDAPHSPTVWPLLGEIIEHEPGRSLLLRRRMDLHEDLYALDHTLAGRHVSALDPDLNGLPVMPMALSIEMMAEAAATLVPGKLLVGMERVRLQRWIPFDEEEPIVLELRAEAVARSGDRATTAVAITIRDLGNRIRPSNSDSPVVEGTVLLGDHYAEPPAIDDFPLTNQRPCRYTPEQMYAEERRLFHGPTFQAVCSTDRHGDEGIEGHLRTLSHAGMFRSTSEPGLLTDPLLIDASTHLLGCWHLTQADLNGRVVFPYELGSVQIYGPRPAYGSRVKCRVAVGATSNRRVSHRIDLIGEDGRLWCRLEPAEYWRFYVPQCFVDFYRKHDEFLVTEDWPVCPAGPAVNCRRIQPVPDILQLVWRNALAHAVLSPKEWAEFGSLPWPELRKNDWLFGRIAAKDAVRHLWRQRHGVRLFPADIEIETDAHGRPIARRRGPASAEELPAISITHSGGVMAALAAFGRPVGIDLERIEPRAPGFEEMAFDESERGLLDQFGDRRDEGITRLWCAKEAVAKALGRGLSEGPPSVAVRGVDVKTGTVQVALGPALVEAYPQWRMDLLRAKTVRDGAWIVATSFCERVTP